MGPKHLYLLATVAVIGLVPGVALAQQAATATPGNDAAPAEIIVTSQKRSERLHEVPAAVSVISGAALTATGGVNIENAQYLVPSLNFRKSGTAINQTLLLRGVGTATFSVAGEPSVTTVIDGVVSSRSGEAFSDLYDVDRIEVLPGPQGTLYGKNASAGLISIVTKRPGKVAAADIGLSYFSANEYRLKAAADLPISDQVRSRFTAFYGQYAGNIGNIAPNVNREVNGYRHFGLRALFVGDATEKLQFTLIADYHRNQDDCCAEVIGTRPTGIGALALAGINFAGDQTRTINQNLVTATQEESYGVSLQADWHLGNYTLTSISAFRRYDNTEIRDGDFVGAAYVNLNELHDFGPQVGRTFTQEVRLTSPATDRISYVAGLYYYYSETSRIFTRNDIVCNQAGVTTLVPCTSASAPASTFPTATAFFGSTFNNFAAFGQATGRITDKLKVIAGLRFTYDKLNVFHSRLTTLTGPGIQPSGPVVNGVTATLANPFRTSTDTTNVSGKAGLQYDLTPETATYATWTRGYKGPAYNVFFNLAANATNVIDSEKSDAFEAGFKNNWFGNRLILNVAGFWAKYRNFQANNPDIVAGVLVTRFTNAGTVSTRGFEASAIGRPFPGLNINGSIAYTDAHVDQFRLPVGAPPTAVVPSGTVLGYAPKWKAALGADYRWVTGQPVDVIFGVQNSYQSSQLSQFDASAANRAATTIRAYSLTDLSIAFTDLSDRYRLTVLVKNVADESFASAITTGGPGGSLRYQIPREANRYWGITASAKF